MKKLNENERWKLELEHSIISDKFVYTTGTISLKELEDCKLLDNSLCVFCGKTRRNILIVPCHHCVYCKECSKKEVTLCPMCGKKIEDQLDINYD